MLALQWTTAQNHSKSNHLHKQSALSSLEANRSHWMTNEHLTAYFHQD